jgi:hypothetical protein
LQPLKSTFVLKPAFGSLGSLFFSVIASEVALLVTTAYVAGVETELRLEPSRSTTRKTKMSFFATLTLRQKQGAE